MAEKTVKKSSLKWRLIAVGVLLTAAAIALGILWYNGYRAAQQRHEQELAEHKAQIDALAKELDDRIAVYEDVSEEVILGIVDTELRAVGELATMEYLYTDANRFSDPKTIFDIDLPFTTKHIVAKWDGVIKAGIDITAVTSEVDEAARTLTFFLPAAKILSHEIDETSFETLDEKAGLFNPIRADDVITLERVSKDAMERRAIESGLLEKAEENARATIAGLMNANPKIRDNYTVLFERIAE